MNYFSLNSAHILAAASLVIAGTLAVFLFDLRRKWRRMFGQDAPRNAEALGEILRRLGATEHELAALAPRVRALEAIGKISVQRIGFLRFNPFAETGGNQSFALALLDGGASGVILSGLYTRDGVRVYAKEIEAGKPKQALSGEEEQVLTQALHDKNSKF